MLHRSSGVDTAEQCVSFNCCRTTISFGYCLADRVGQLLRESYSRPRRMKLGSLIKSALSAIGVTESRVTSLGHATGLVRPGEDCGCSRRAAKMDRWSENAVRWLRVYVPIRPPNPSSPVNREKHVLLPCGQWLNGDMLQPAEMTQEQQREAMEAGLFCATPEKSKLFRSLGFNVVEGC